MNPSLADAWFFALYFASITSWSAAFLDLEASFFEHYRELFGLHIEGMLPCLPSLLTVCAALHMHWCAGKPIPPFPPFDGCKPTRTPATLFFRTPELLNRWAAERAARL